ncbi:MAG: hypothetical protein II476_01540 [Bacteroidales bacterium]|nr:hypothetical protein [Bacteroidales bacterium]MBQ5527918.1 hypothetical protein [Bacteroidales bacterium]
MFESIKDLLRKGVLRKLGGRQESGIIPVSSVRTAVAFIDVKDPSFDECKLKLQAFYRENGIKGEVFFFDFRKIGKGERLITSITTTILARDLDWLGRPVKEKVDHMLGSNPDMFISLLPENCFPLEFMTKCSKAKFKIGRFDMSDDAFDLVVTDPAGKTLSQAESFDEIKKLLALIK